MRLGIVLFFYFYSCALAAQNWQPLKSGMDDAVRVMYTDTVNNILYAGGNFVYADGIYVEGIAKWNGVKWDSMASGGVGLTFAIAQYNSELYIGGGYLGRIKKWNGLGWDSVGGGVNGLVGGLFVYNNELLAMGFFDSIGGIKASKIARWNGSYWSNFDTTDFGDWSLKSAIVYKNSLYIAGNFDYINEMEEIAMWNGTGWQSVGGGIKGDAWVSALEVYKDELYVGGYFFKQDGNAGNFIMKWNGIKWSEVGGGVTGIYPPPANGQIHDMLIFNDELYVAGVFEYAGGVPAQHIAKWNGTEWCGLGSSFDNRILSLGVYNNEIYAGCGLTADGDTVNYIAKWTGGNYVDTCGVITNINPEIPNLPVEINIFPNPSDGKFTVENLPVFSGKVDITVYNALGQEVFEKEIFSGNKQISLPVLSDGLYFIKINSGKNTFYDKILIQR